MTWPAPDLPINFTNATQSLDTHPTAHNATNLSLNDDYRPELTRVGGELQDVRDQVVVSGPANDITLITDGKVERRDQADALRGNVLAYQTTIEGQTDNDAFSTGGNPVEYYRVTHTGTFPAGGRVTVQAHVLAVFNVGATIAELVPGVAFNGAATATYVDSYRRVFGKLSVAGDTVGLMSIWEQNIPPGTTSVAGAIGVADTGNSFRITKGGLIVKIESY